MLGGRRWKDIARAILLSDLGQLRVGPKKLAEPVALSSTLPTNFRLPPTAARLGFDLLALRTRRKRDSRDVKTSIQGPSERRGRNLQKIQFSTFFHREEACSVDIFVDRRECAPSTKSERHSREPATRPSWGIG